MALDVSGLTALVARGERARCEKVIGWLARVGAECTHRVAAAVAPSPTRTPPPSPGSAPDSSAASIEWVVCSARVGSRGGGEERCALTRPSLRAEGGCTPVPHPSRTGEWGCTTGMWGRSAAMRKLIGTNPFHPERAGP